MLMSIIIQLHGSATASLGERSYTARGNSHGPISPLVRRLIAEEIIGANDLVTVARGDVICFMPCRAILWAEIDIVDTDDGIVRRPAYIGPHAPGAHALALRLGAQKGRTRAMGGAVQAQAHV
jgi:hypothetical protein